jgi:hypothetical protein
VVSDSDQGAGYTVFSEGDRERVTLLGRPWQLREVADVEALARAILERQLGKRGAHLRTDFYDEAICFLLEVAVRADRGYNPARGPWEPFLRWKLTNGVTDFYRREFGRTRWQFSAYTHQRERPELISLNDQRSAGELDGALVGSTGEFEAGRLDLERALNS